jgi:hypothetical protein
MVGKLKSDRRRMNASNSINKGFSMVIVNRFDRAATVARLAAFPRGMGNAGR